MTFAPANAMVWAEIPVTDLNRAKRFYSDAFGYDLAVTEEGPNPTVMIPGNDTQGTGLHLYPGKPATEGQGPTLHLAVPGKLEDTMDRFTRAGGTLLPMSPVTIPPGRFVYGQDPDGNSIGLFEPAS